MTQSGNCNQAAKIYVIEINSAINLFRYVLIENYCIFEKLDANV